MYTMSLNHARTRSLVEPERAEIDQMTLDQVEETLLLNMARITQAVRHHAGPVGQDIYDDWVADIPALLFRYHELTGKMHIIESLDHTDY